MIILFSAIRKYWDMLWIQISYYSMPRLEGVHYKYPTSCSQPTYPPSTLNYMHTH